MKLLSKARSESLIVFQIEFFINKALSEILNVDNFQLFFQSFWPQFVPF